MFLQARYLLLLAIVTSLSMPLGIDSAHADDWRHAGRFIILTTPDGADLPASTTEKDFPLLIRLHHDWFDFTTAQPNGEDVRLETDSGAPLQHQIEHWDAVAGTASLWVRIPEIRGNARQVIRMRWGNVKAASESDGRAVFNESNGYRSVWHLGDQPTDAVGTLTADDKGTRAVPGVIGPASHFPGNAGIFCGDQIEALPTAPSVHTTQAWFRAQSANGIVVGWGNEQAQGKVVMQYRSPPLLRIDGYFSDANVAEDIEQAMPTWVHAVHTYRLGQSLLYLNGRLAGEGNPRAAPLAVQRPARMWIGGWYNRYAFVGDIDELRISNVLRSADWIRMEYENQRPLQTMVGPLIPEGTEFSVSQPQVVMKENETVRLSAKAGGAQKVYWSVIDQDTETVVAVDRFAFDYDAGRVTSETNRILRFKTVFADNVQSIDIPVKIQESIPEPEFVLAAPLQWDGRESIEVVPKVANLPALQAHGVDVLNVRWQVSGLATIDERTPEKLVLHRSQNSGELSVSASIANGGERVSASTKILVEEPAKDLWVHRLPEANEQPVDRQFYARDDQNEGTLYCNGSLPNTEGEVFLNVFADDKPFFQQRQRLSETGAYAFTVKLKPGLIQYRVAFGRSVDGDEQMLHTAQDIVCGDAYIIEGQSNALATDTGEQSPAVTHPWVRTYGNPRSGKAAGEANLWCLPVWKARNGELAELGYWGMELAKRLVETRQVPICIINGAVGGTRIDQHQRNEADPTDLQTIYGRLLWRVREARLTHGIRAVLWHQGESDQGADGPDGGYGWQSYEKYFVAMSAAWKRDFPNVQHYYVFQIWPNACSMGGGNGDMLREVQRTLPRLYSNLDVMSTLGIEPPGGCHYPLKGWAQFATRVEPLLGRDFYGQVTEQPITPPNLVAASFTTSGQQTIKLEFDQPVRWDDQLIDQFYLDDVQGEVVAGSCHGKRLTLQLRTASQAKKITYLKETAWSQAKLLRGDNGLAALTFCDVPIAKAVAK